jgi:hypothetical protein
MLNLKYTYSYIIPLTNSRSLQLRPSNSSTSGRKHLLYFEVTTWVLTRVPAVAILYFSYTYEVHI